MCFYFELFTVVSNNNFIKLLDLEKNQIDEEKFYVYVQYSFFFICLEILFIYLFLKRREGREKEGEKHPCVVAFHMPPTGDMAHNPGTGPDW